MHYAATHKQLSYKSTYAFQCIEHLKLMSNYVKTLCLI